MNMAWYYPKHTCGHEGDRIQLYGKHENRERILEGIERHECPDCRRKEADKTAEATGLPLLKGSDKQVAWASDIRVRASRLCDKFETIKLETSAKWWIDHRTEVKGV
jgi:hypothetical protein